MDVEGSSAIYGLFSCVWVPVVYGMESRWLLVICGASGFCYAGKLLARGVVSAQAVAASWRLGGRGCWCVRACKGYAMDQLGMCTMVTVW